MNIRHVTEEELIQSVVSNRKEGCRYAFLLGAGASISSGIPDAASMAEAWLDEIEKTDPETYQALISKNGSDSKNLSALYPTIYQARFAGFEKDGYAAIENIMSAKTVQPSLGYTVLAQILNQTRHNLVVTTNFDRLTETALLYYENTHARVIAHEIMLGVVSIDDQRPSIIKVHRDMYCSPISTEQEITELNEKWNGVIRSVLDQYSVIVIGYGGHDGGLITILEKALEGSDQACLYWCHRDGEGVPEKLQCFIGGSRQRVIPVRIISFDELMLKLNKALGFSLLSENGTFERMARERRSNYESQLNKIVERSETRSKDDKQHAALQALVANTWWEVQLQVKGTGNVDEKDQLYQAGIKKFPQSHELLNNYALFLHQIRQDYDEAEKYYRKAVAAAPEYAINNGNYATFNGNYALFLHQICKDYDEAEKYYRKAVAAAPEHATNNGNYALFLHQIRHDYDEAEKYYRKAVAAAPEHANNNGNYAGFLLARGRKPEAIPFLEKAEQLADAADLRLDLAFYRLAHFPETADESRRSLRQLLAQGARSPYWDFSDNIEQAEREGCLSIEELRTLAQRINAVDE